MSFKNVLDESEFFKLKKQERVEYYLWLSSILSEKTGWDCYAFDPDICLLKRPEGRPTVCLPRTFAEKLVEALINV